MSEALIQIAMIHLLLNTDQIEKSIVFRRLLIAGVYTDLIARGHLVGDAVLSHFLNCFRPDSLEGCQFF